MNRMMKQILALLPGLALLVPLAKTTAAGLDWYVKRDSWQETLTVSLEARRQSGGGGGDLRLSEWSWAGPFTVPDGQDLGKVFGTTFAPETEAETIRWTKQPGWNDGVVNRLGTAEFAAYYLTRTITAPTARRVRLHLGNDDAITVWLNGKKVFSRLVAHWCAPDQETLDLARDASGLYVNLFVGSRVEVKMAGAKIALRQTTRYPWQGEVKIAVEPERPARFDLHVRIPTWCQGVSAADDLYQIAGRPASGAARLRVNGQLIEQPEMVRGYARVRREWKPGDVVELTLDAVWLPETPAAAQPQPVPTIASRAKPSASHSCPTDSATAMNDQIEPAASDDTKIPRFTWWDHRGTKEWVQYDFDQPQQVSSVEVYWWDERRIQHHCRVPAAWQLLYKDGSEWKPVARASAYGTQMDQFNRVTFTPVTTTALRIEVQLQPYWSGGILEWKAH